WGDAAPSPCPPPPRRGWRGEHGFSRLRPFEWRAKHLYASALAWGCGRASSGDFGQRNEEGKRGRLRRLLLREVQLLLHLLAHQVFLDLAGDSHREGIDELDVARDLVVGGLALAGGLDLL